MSNFAATFFVYHSWWDDDLLWNNTLNWIFVLLAHWNNIPWVVMSLHSLTLTWFQTNQSFLLLLMLSGEAADTNFDSTLTGPTPTIYHTRAANTIYHTRAANTIYHTRAAKASMLIITFTFLLPLEIDSHIDKFPIVWFYFVWGP
jgi:hypothetical protein